MKPEAVDIAIIGAGPYGLSLAAHLRDSGRSVRTFGSPMQFWAQHMPKGMSLKSEGFASNLYDPGARFPLKAYCAENGVAYADIGLPVKLETFIAYGREFQRRYVPALEDTRIAALTAQAGGFELRTAGDETLRARRVVVAAGIMNFAHLPAPLAELADRWVTHSSRHGDLSRFAGQRVAVVGAGASAVDIAALLNRAGAHVDLITRRTTIAFHNAPVEPRPLLARLKAPRSGLGTGWRSRLCTDIPDVFHALPVALRLRAVEKHLGPAPCWFTRDAVVGHVQMHLGTTLAQARVQGEKLQLGLRNGNGQDAQLEVDHVIAGTGYKVALARLPFLDAALQTGLRKVADTPVLDHRFESSVPGLHFIGAAAANSFGPLLRFAYGANFAAKRVARHLARA